MPPVTLTASLPAVVLLIVLAVSQAASDASGRQAPLKTDQYRAALMRHHFAQVLDVHDAIVRGDLDDARTRARGVAAAPGPEGLPAATGSYLMALQREARRAAAATELEDVTAATAAMLAACGDCHRAAGTMPSVPAPAVPEVGGLVGHMLAHGAGVELMVQGLTVPSASLWQEGARRLGEAELRRRDLPRDRALTKELAAEEARVHALARRAQDASDTRSRIYVYSEMLESCHACHSLHPNLWGPGRP